MKKTINFLILLVTLITSMMFLSSCENKSERCCFRNDLEEILQDSNSTQVTNAVALEVQSPVDSVCFEKVKMLEASVDYYRHLCDSLSTRIRYSGYDAYADYANARKIEKIKYYIQITEKNPNNQNFFFGWVKRTMAGD